MSKIAYISEYPFTILRDLSCPIVHEDRWNKYWILGSSFGAPFLIAFFADHLFILIVVSYTDVVFKVVPVWALLLVIAVVLLLCNWFLTSFQEPPAKGFYLVVLVLIGFTSSVLWISAVAQELVSLLNAIGLMLHISPVILGLTILAWGNSLGDMVSDISLARQGYAQMSMGGVYACTGILSILSLAPTFNLTIGMGISLLITCIKSLKKE